MAGWKKDQRVGIVEAQTTGREGRGNCACPVPARDDERSCSSGPVANRYGEADRQYRRGEASSGARSPVSSASPGSVAPTVVIERIEGRSAPVGQRLDLPPTNACFRCRRDSRPGESEIAIHALSQKLTRRRRQKMLWADEGSDGGQILHSLQNQDVDLVMDLISRHCQYAADLLGETFKACPLQAPGQNKHQAHSCREPENQQNQLEWIRHFWHAPSRVGPARQYPTNLCQNVIT